MTRLAVKEVDWMTAAGDVLDLLGWRWVHHRPSRRKSGRWETPTQGSGARGFPDIVAVRPPRVLWLELKTSKGRVSPDQETWNQTLVASGQEAFVLVFPRDWQRFLDLTARDPVQMTLTSNSTTSSDWRIEGSPNT